VLSFALSCSGDDAAPGDGGAEQHADAGRDADADGDGSGGDGGAVERDVCLGDEEPNVTCPDNVGPFDGPCAPKGACCKRSSNSAEITMLGPNEAQVLEYRMTDSVVINQPRSLGLPPPLTTDPAPPAWGNRQSMLLRFEQPRSDGELTAGSGARVAGPGRYNCDGTYSFYSDQAAPSRMTERMTDPARWSARDATAEIDPELEGVERTRVAWAADPNREVTCVPFFLPGTQALDYEVCTSGFELLAFDTSAAGEDCQGAWSYEGWERPGRYQVFASLADNKRDIMDTYGETFCQFLSFGVVMPEDRDLDCLSEPRCAPGTDGCNWVALPDSLCPESDSERELFHCHLGALDNPNAEDGYPTSLNCSMTAPSTPLDPDVDPSVSKGQCCDPLGASTDGLPACNAFRIEYAFAAAAVEITDERQDEPPPECDGQSE
jgi:hypothetical protein